MFTTHIHPADEDGNCRIDILDDGRIDETVTVRSDMAGQWASQEVEVRNDPRVYGVDLPEEALADADERRRWGLA